LWFTLRLAKSFDGTIAGCRYDPEDGTGELVDDRLGDGIDRGGEDFGSGHGSGSSFDARFRRWQP
jgi:hypothetical protein